MPRQGGLDYYAQYYNNEGTMNKKRKKGKLGKPTSAEVLSWLEDIVTDFSAKYGSKVKLIRMSKEMKDMIDSRTKGKGFLKGIKFIVTDLAFGLRTIEVSELDEEIK